MKIDLDKLKKNHSETEILEMFQRYWNLNVELDKLYENMQNADQELSDLDKEYHEHTFTGDDFAVRLGRAQTRVWDAKMTYNDAKKELDHISKMLKCDEFGKWP